MSVSFYTTIYPWAHPSNHYTLARFSIKSPIRPLIQDGHWKPWERNRLRGEAFGDYPSSACERNLGKLSVPLNLPNTPDTREEQLSLQHRATVGVRLVGNEHNNGPVGNARELVVFLRFLLHAPQVDATLSSPTECLPVPVPHLPGKHPCAEQV